MNNSKIIEAFESYFEYGTLDVEDVQRLLKEILSINREPGVNLSDVHQLLQDIIEI